MEISTLFLMAIALGTDAFSLSIGIGMAGIKVKQTLIFTTTVLIFHIIMPIAGYFAGEFFGVLLGKIAAIFGALILIYLGLKMSWEATGEKNGVKNKIIIANIWGLLLLAASVSLDALSVGFTLGTRRVAVGLAALIFGLVAGGMTFTGLGFGQKIGGWIGAKSELIGGFILVAIGIKLFL